VLAEQFDAFMWFEETKAVTPLPAGRPTGRAGYIFLQALATLVP
jgi:hypothetical protein